MEISAAQNLASFRDHQRIVCHAAELAADDRERMVQHVARGAVHLRYAAE
jgi:hypothetical protein